VRIHVLISPVHGSVGNETAVARESHSFIDSLLVSARKVFPTLTLHHVRHLELDGPTTVVQLV
jgi:hypothetical protein